MTLADRHPTAAPVSRIADRSHEAYGKEVVAFTSARTQEERNRAFAAIVESHRDALIRFCAAKLDNDPHAAEDAVTETFIAAWEGLGRIEKPRTVRKWLFTVARRQCLHLRKLRFLEVHDVPEVAQEKPPGVHDGLKWLDLLVATLAPEEQRLHNLYFQQHLRGRKLAAALGEDPAQPVTVYKRIHRHKAWLRAAVEAEIVVHEAPDGPPCPVLAKILETAGHVVRPSNVLPVELGRKVAHHIGRCPRCSGDLERGRLRYGPLALLPVLGLWGLHGTRDNAVEPASFSAADPGPAEPGADAPESDRAKGGFRRRAPGWSVAIGLVTIIVLILGLTVRTENGDGGSDFSLFQRPDPADPGQSATVPGRTAVPGLPGAPGNGGPGTPDPSFPGATAPEPAPGGPVTPPPPGVLAVTPPAVNLPLYATTATVTVAAGSAMSWTATSTDPAVSVTPAAGNVEAGKTQPIKVTVNRNATAKPGTGLVVTSSTGQRVTVAVGWPTPGNVGVTTPRIDLGARAATATFSVTAANGNLSWSAGSPHPALTVSPAGGSLAAGKGALVTVRLTRPIGTGGDVPLRVTTPDAQQVTVLVHWLATPGTVRTSTGAVHIGASESSARFTVSVTGGTNTWTAALSAPGCAAPTCRLALSRTSGSGTAEITVTLWPHPSSVDPGAHSRGTITLSTPDGQRLTVDVTWDPYEPG